MRPETDLEKALYQCDLMQDEFIRISHLTDNSEIKGLCERAQVRLKSEVPFFERLEKLERKARKYDALIASKDGDEWMPYEEFVAKHGEYLIPILQRLKGK